MSSRRNFLKTVTGLLPIGIIAGCCHHHTEPDKTSEEAVKEAIEKVIDITPENATPDIINVGDRVKFIDLPNNYYAQIGDLKRLSYISGEVVRYQMQVVGGIHIGPLKTCTYLVVRIDQLPGTEVSILDHNVYNFLQKIPVHYANVVWCN